MRKGTNQIRRECDEPPGRWDESKMQCEEANDWLSVSAGLLSLAKLVTFGGGWNINYATFQHLNKQEINIINVI